LPEVLMPRLSDTMEEGTVAKWLKRPGDRIGRGDVLAEIDTDKATMELESYEEGVLETLLVPEGTTVPIGTPLAVVGPGEESSTAAPGSAPPATSNGSPATTANAPAAPGGSATTSQALQSGPETEPPKKLSLRPAGPPRSSPLARRVARRYGVDLASVRGSGPGGRVVRADVERAAAALSEARAPSGRPAPARPFVGSEGAAARSVSELGPSQTDKADTEEVPLGNLRRLTAERLAKSLEAPHFYLTKVVDATALASLRAELAPAVEASAGVKLTLNDLVVKAAAKALRSHPAVNSSWGGDKILRHRRVNVGIAVAVPDGLVVPVIKDADEKGLVELAAEARSLANRARDGKLALADISEGTFTVSNLGMFGIDHFTAVLNPPQAAILAVGAAKPEPVVRDGQLSISTLMSLTLTLDHRVLDGAMAAGFLADLAELLEHPLRALI
jgi:pyruvate dehydrogenase E2 component (dihydrolipoamide acetyltransferase)